MSNQENENPQHIIDMINGFGYLDAKVFWDGATAAIMPLLYTHAIIYDIDQWGYGDRWCYKNYSDAKTALDAWDGEGEPGGWHRHPSSGRRRDENGVETINF